jgi:signal transduction histidine kinase/HPt (histidine-containing phosphotransfer) domain-containing protein
MTETDRRLALVLQNAGVDLWDYDHQADCVTQNCPAAPLAQQPDSRPPTIADWLRTVHPDDLPLVRKAFDLARTDAERPLAIECRLCTEDGDWRWVHVRGGILERDAAGRPLRSAGTIMDIPPPRGTEDLPERQRRLEKLVLARTVDLAHARIQAESGSRVKSSFLANMSHELRTPMNAIIGFAHLARRGATEPDQHGYLAKITEAAEHLLRLINDVLDVSSIEAGKLVLEEADFALDEVLERTWVAATDQVDNKGLERVTTVAPGLKVPLRGDPRRLGQVLLNLLTNAIKFTEHGSVALRAQLLESGADSLKVRFEVTDTGIGISTDDQRDLFQPFTQADNSTARRYGGTGLGLTISAELVHLMGGEIGVDSQPGLGSTFWFTVRLGHGGTRRLPLADDNAINREYARQPPSVSMASDALSGVAAASVADNQPNDGSEDLARRLATIDGLDLAQGLRSFRGRIVPYQRLLGQFANAHKHDMSTLVECLEGANVAEARRVAHSLKGAAAALGVSHIQNHAAQLEAALREILEGQWADEAAGLARLRPMAKTLEAELTDFALAVGSTLATETAGSTDAPPPEPAVTNWPALRAALEQLHALLAADDMQASEVLASATPMLRAALGGKAESLIRAIEIFDFPAALTTLREIRAAHVELAGKA